MIAKGGKVKKYEQKNFQFQQNKLFQRELNGKEYKLGQVADVKEIRKFQSDVRGVLKKKHKMDAE